MKIPKRYFKASIDGSFNWGATNQHTARYCGHSSLPMCSARSNGPNSTEYTRRLGYSAGCLLALLQMFVNHFEFDVKRSKHGAHAFTPPAQDWVFAPKKFVAYKVRVAALRVTARA